MVDSRTRNGLISLSALRNDLRSAGRMFTKSPLFTGVVVVTLALGIGLNTAVFAAVDAMLLRPLPGVRASNELVQLYRSSPGGDGLGSNSIPHFWDLRERSKSVYSDVAAWSFQNLSITADDRPRAVYGVMVSANFFSVLGARPATGRFFTPDEDVGRGAHPVAVLSDAGWRSLFGGDQNVVGRQVIVNGQNMTIIGIAAPGFSGAMPMLQPSMWVPLMQLAQVKPGSVRDFENRGNNYLNVIARLAPGISVAQARARMDAITAELRRELPADYEKSGINLIRQDDAGIHPSMRGAQVGLSAVVMTVVAILLLIACVNVANLFLARARDRAREMAIRLALGARRSELVRQLLVESVVVSFVAGVVGVVIAYVAIGLANSITLPMDIDFQPDLQLSPMVLGFAFGTALVTGILFGLVPALQATSPSLVPALKGEAPTGTSRSRTSKGLVIAQMALSIVLLVCAGLFLVNLRSATTIDKGFTATQLLIADVDPSLQAYNRGNTEAFYTRLSTQLAAVPGVESVGMIDNVPLGFSNSDRGVDVPGYVPSANENLSVRYASIAPEYFAAMGIPLRTGRGFTARDDSAAVPVLVVNERFVEKFWPGQNAIGRTVRTAGRLYTVVGVVPTGKYQRLGEDPQLFMYFPQAQLWRAGMSLMIRTSGDPNAVIPALRREVATLDPNMPLANIRSLEKHLGSSLLPARIAGVALGVFGLLGLLLASVGMYGVMAYSVSQRTREIGIRMAIGATATDVIRLIMRQGLTLVTIGTVIGLIAAIGASRALSSILYGSSANDPATFALVPLVLIAVAALATFVPARRAAMVDPAVTLRAE
ncbi:MAG: ABC transporter permease [Gemmatimonadaceae bacterium]|nr:ABC transporter permease [Gemmatimonadaceae bacterium]